ncbi:MAG TPA: hypothetical protein VEC99_16100, partial [Clostridia bacterium]|nr:hypothetical protein [Clostridia bacterium]
QPYGRKSELAMTYGSTLRYYDERHPYTLEREPVLDQRLVYLQHEVSLRWRHNWDRLGRWQSTSKFGYAFNEDNGSGYFNFHRYQTTHQLRYQAQRWKAETGVKLSAYDYPSQTVSFWDTSLRWRLTLNCSVRGEVQVYKKLKLFGEYDYEQTWGNNVFDRYAVNTVSGGLDWSW